MDRRAQIEWVAETQARQRGLIATWQAKEHELAEGVLRHALQSGRIRRVRRGVYASTSVPPSYEQAVLAAVLSVSGPGLLVATSHLCAARLCGLPAAGGPHPLIEVTTSWARCPEPAGVRLHRSRHLSVDDVTEVGGVPVTVATRIIVDLSMRLDRAALGKLADEALRRRITSLGALQRTALRLRSAPGRSQHRVLALVLARTGEDASESALEHFAIDSLKRFGVRLPTQQLPIRTRGGRRRRMDLAYEREKVAIEALGFEYHGLRSRFDDDAVRNNELVRRGLHAALRHRCDDGLGDRGAHCRGDR